MIDYTLILNRKYIGQEWTINGDDYSGLTWLSNTPKPTQKELDDQWDSVKEEIVDEKNAQESRKAAILNRLGLTEDEIKLLLS